MPTMPPPGTARALNSAFIHTETVTGLPLVWLTYTTAGHVQITIEHPDDPDLTGPWVANAYRLDRAPRRPPLLRCNWHCRHWLDKTQQDLLTEAALRLWRAANYRL